MSGPNVVCQVSSNSDGIEFLWSSGGGFFKSYFVAGPVLDVFKTRAVEARDLLWDLVHVVHGGGGKQDEVIPCLTSLARTGYDLYNAILPRDDATASRIRPWLERLATEATRDNEVITLEVVMINDTREADPVLYVPWNLVYDRDPDGLDDPTPGWIFDPTHADAFWARRYHLACTRRVEPLKREPIWERPYVLMVVDETLERELSDAQRRRLDEFRSRPELRGGCHLDTVRTFDELRAAVKRRRPRVLYWLCHSNQGLLHFGGRDVRPDELYSIISGQESADRPWQSLAFLNGCFTADKRGRRSLIESLHVAGLSGVIATEQEVIDFFANECGLDFLGAFLCGNRSVGSILHEVHSKKYPVGLVYGGYCPPELQIRQSGGEPGVPEVGPTMTTPSAVETDTTERRGTFVRAGRPLPKLPGRPYRSLSFYDRDHRALFVGREEDVVRFSKLLDEPETRVLVLQGESGVGKSSFLRAGVIPYLEEECHGYRFLRTRKKGDAAGHDDPRSVLFVPAGCNLSSHLAEALCAYAQFPLTYRDPTGKSVRLDLPRVLTRASGSKRVDRDAVRDALLKSPEVLGDILRELARLLPFALVLVIDQAEEIFTLTRDAKAPLREKHLATLRALLDSRGDFKVVISLRTEYYGRLVDRLRGGRRRVSGLREYYLVDFGPDDLTRIIERPCSPEPLVTEASDPQSPRKEYGFHYGDGVVKKIVDDVMTLGSLGRDSVLPLLQVLCDQLFEKLPERKAGAVRSITLKRFERQGGVEGGLRRHVDELVARLAQELKSVRGRDSTPRRKARYAATIRIVLSQLQVRQADGLCTTAFLEESHLRKLWEEKNQSGRVFAHFVRIAMRHRLLKDRTRWVGDKEVRYLGLAHDALARVVVAWQEENEARRKVESQRTPKSSASPAAPTMTRRAAAEEQVDHEPKSSEAPAAPTMTRRAAAEEQVDYEPTPFWKKLFWMKLW